MTGKSEATVTTLTAEVKTLMIGSRQVTLSIWHQLDRVHPDKITTFGRVSPPGNAEAVVWVVGSHRETGALVRSSYPLGRQGRLDYIASQPGWQRTNTSDNHAVSPEIQEERTRIFDKYRGRYQIKDEKEKDAAEQEYRKAADELRAKAAAQHFQLEEELKAKAAEWQELPLIVLAGLGLK